MENWTLVNVDVERAVKSVTPVSHFCHSVLTEIDEINRGKQELSDVQRYFDGSLTGGCYSRYSHAWNRGIRGILCSGPFWRDHDYISAIVQDPLERTEVK
jgi:hypothetical protein